MRSRNLRVQRFFNVLHQCNQVVLRTPPSCVLEVQPTVRIDIICDTRHPHVHVGCMERVQLADPDDNRNDGVVNAQISIKS